MLRRAAREHDCVVGGGYIAIRGHDARGTYAVVEPDGTARFHDKDQPSFWENNYYSGGTDDGVIDTSLGTIGIANGFEWGRTRTARRMLGRVNLLAGGMHFPSFPTLARDEAVVLGPRPPGARCSTPARRRRGWRGSLGVPAVHPSHVGDFVMETMLVPGLAWPSMCVGETRDLRRRRRRARPPRLRGRRGLDLRRRRHRRRAPPARSDAAGLLELAAPDLRPRRSGTSATRTAALKYEGMKLLRRHRWQQ